MTKNKRALVAVAVVIVAAAGFAIFLQADGMGSDAPSAGIVRISPAEYVTEFMSAAESHILIDVRTPAEFASGHIPGAMNIPVDAIASRLNEIPRDQPVVVYCRSGNRSAAAARILADAGYGDVRDMGGIIAWSAAGYPVQ